jgi:hypothetical protein
MTSWHHFHPIVTQNCQNLAQLCQCNSVRVHLSAYVPHWKVLNHCIHVQFLYVKQSNVVNSLNHDIMTSFPLNSHPEPSIAKSDLVSAVSAVQQCKGALICLHTSLKGAKTRYICPLQIRESIKGSLQPWKCQYRVSP